MKNKLILLLFIPVVIFAHIKDERLFKTGRVPASAMILLDRSGSMNAKTYHYDLIVRLNDYSWTDNRTHQSGWYDREITPDGPGSMDDFDGLKADGNWILDVEWDGGWRNRRVELSWTLMILSDGGWHTYDGGSHTWTGRGTQDRQIEIEVSGLKKVDDVQCYVNVTTSWGLTIGRMRINLILTPLKHPYKSRRIKDAILVIHSLLDADNDGFVTEQDEEYLPVKLGHGFHRNSSVYIPEGYRRTGELDCESYNERRMRWEEVEEEPGILYTDTIGSHFVDIWEHINYTDVGGSTPNGVLIARSCDYINDYRENYPDLWCMKHNLIIITDGETNNPREECDEGSKDIVRQAYRAWHEDSIKVYAVGFGTGITEGGANELNWVARWGGTQSESDKIIDSLVNEGMDTNAVDGSSCAMSDPQRNNLIGYAYIAEDAEALASALARIFMEIAGQENHSYAAGEVTSVEEEFLSTEYKARLFIATFNPDTLPIWQGDLKALRMDTVEFNLDSIPSHLIIWSARDSLKVDKSADNRNIYGINQDGRMLSFNISNFDSADFNVDTRKTAVDVIDRIRDGLTDDNKGELGDIFHSAPLRVHVPNYFYIDQGFNRFYTEMKNRSPLIYAGGNDGMLHVFADSVMGMSGRAGEEIMGIVPMNFIPELKKLLYQHEYFVDADPIAADVWFPATEADSIKQWNEWHTILFAPQGEGGRSFTVLDVTDPLNDTPHPMDSTKYLFSAIQDTLSASTFGFTTSTPIIRKVGVSWIGKNKRIDRFFAFMGGGQWPDPMDIALLDSIFNEGEVKGNMIMWIDIWKAATSGINGYLNLIQVDEEDASRMNAPFPSAPTLINIDPEFGNRFDFLFMPDAFGQLWFVDLRNPDPNSWKAKCIFIPELPTSSDSTELYKWHPAFFRPLVWKDPVYSDYWITYGTGNRSDLFSSSADRFYALKYPAEALEDTTIEIPVYTEANLGVPEIPTSAGWMHILPHTNEKVVTPSIFYQDSVKFFTFTPGSDDPYLSPCEVGGSGSIARSYTFDIRAGGTSEVVGEVEGTGLPQPPRYSFSLDGTGLMISQVSGKIKIERTKGFKSYKEIIKWKELR